MEKHFCDRCGQEIKGIPKKNIVFDSELCDDCSEKIKYFINNSNKAIAQYKIEHGYTLSKEEIDILNEDEVIIKKDPCEGCTCFEAFNREDYTSCPNLIHTIDHITMQHKFHCNEKNTTINFTVDDFINKSKTVTPRDFEEESE